MKHTAIYNGKKVEFDFEKGERVCLKHRQDDTGTVIEVENGLFINIEWDEHCKNRLGVGWMPMSIMKLLMTDESTSYGTDCRLGGGCE